MLFRIALFTFLSLAALTAQDGNARGQDRATALQLARRGRYPQAEEILKHLVESEPLDLASQSALAQLNYRFGYYDAALLPASKVIELRPDDREMRILQAVCLFKTGGDAAAVNLTRHLLTANPPPNDIDLTLTYAQYLYEHGEWESALAQVQCAIEFAPQHPIGYFWLARILLQQEKLAEAAAAAERSVSLAPQLPFARNLLVRIYRLQGRQADMERESEWLRAYEARKASP